MLYWQSSLNWQILKEKAQLENFQFNCCWQYMNLGRQWEQDCAIWILDLTIVKMI